MSTKLIDSLICCLLIHHKSVLDHLYTKSTIILFKFQNSFPIIFFLFLSAKL